MSGFQLVITPQARMVSNRMKTQSIDASTEVTEVLDLTVVFKEAIVKMLQQAIMKDISSTNLK